MGIYFKEDVLAAAFRQVENGYVFSATPTWLVGPSRRYLVNEAQKMAIDERVWRTNQALDSAIQIAMIFVVTVAWVITDALGLGFLPYMLFAVITWAPILATAQIYRNHKLRPLLAGLPPTRERGLTTWSERFKLRAAHSSSARLSGLALSGLCFAAFGLWAAIDLGVHDQKAGPAVLVILDWLAVVLFAALAVYYFTCAMCIALYKYKVGRT